MKPEKVILLHGLFCNRFWMSYVAWQLRKRGFKTYSYSYQTVKKSVPEEAERLIVKIKDLQEEAPLYWVGHSMGGVMIRHIRALAPDLFKGSRVVTLGTPHRGSLCAQTLHRRSKIFRWMLGRSLHYSLDGKVPLWDPDIPLYSIAGTQSAVGNWMHVFPKNVVNDGLVALEETQMPEFKTKTEVPLNHMALLFNKRVMTLTANWLEN